MTHSTANRTRGPVTGSPTTGNGHDPKLEIRGVTKNFVTRAGEVDALASCDLALEQGEFLTIVGPSGCGKSTLMMVAAGLDEASSGSILVDGEPAGGPGPQRSVVFQRFALFPSRTVADNICFGMQQARVPKPEQAERLEEQLTLMGLGKFRDSYPHELSGGMQQRVAIARSLVLRPEILLMDEPFGALDAQTRLLLQEELVRLRQVHRFTVLFITHSVEEAVYLADRVAVMTRRPGAIKTVIDVPGDAEWRSSDIETAMGHPEFTQLRQRVWKLVKEEIVAS
ncbi:NitT/TauT family transport system ATP-binding protein [Haloactinopolyspora alba]|uniref:NitT/TauT family transport system ATP-binding protein n=1 Tax=Haloactinopolyspora alba TaxID=648780 RepID=A0A2P8DRE6_9ACTN|nr:ABC transporter ATP-binding protein [Haloactinopolyspora alba]PSK99785.1 NitT/TauT family transport system ATP-binding protein [Haloactinopolyspora alba]